MLYQQYQTGEVYKLSIHPPILWYSKKYPERHTTIHFHGFYPLVSGQRIQKDLIHQLMHHVMHYLQRLHILKSSDNGEYKLRFNAIYTMLANGHYLHEFFKLLSIFSSQMNNYQRMRRKDCDTLLKP